MTFNDIFEFIGKVVAVGGGAAAFAYGIFKYFGKKWLDVKFEERLEAFKHEQNLQMEQYRFEINTLFNRLTKIHEKEFEVLPRAWTLLQNAIGRAAKFTSPLQTFPNINSMSEEQIEETLAKTEFSNSQKDEIRRAEDKTKAYTDKIFWYDLNEVKTSVNDFHNYLIYNKVFLSKELFKSFSELDKILSDAVLDREIMEKLKYYSGASNAFTKIRDETQPIIDTIELQIQQRLHFAEAD